METFLNAIKAQAGAMDQSMAQPRFGLVASVDPMHATARVRLQPEDVLTGWLPILSPWVGAGWGLACPPSPGDQVFILAQEGDADHGVIAGRAFSDTAGSPAAEVGELWLVHKSGSFVKLLNDGSVRVKGHLHVDGDVFDQHGSLAQLRSHYNLHVHASLASVPSLQD